MTCAAEVGLSRCSRGSEEHPRLSRCSRALRTPRPTTGGSYRAGGRSTAGNTRRHPRDTLLHARIDRSHRRWRSRRRLFAHTVQERRRGRGPSPSRFRRTKRRRSAGADPAARANEPRRDPAAHPVSAGSPRSTTAVASTPYRGTPHRFEEFPERCAPIHVRGGPARERIPTGSLGRTSGRVQCGAERRGI